MGWQAKSELTRVGCSVIALPFFKAPPPPQQKRVKRKDNKIKLQGKIEGKQSSFLGVYFYSI